MPPMTLHIYIRKKRLESYFLPFVVERRIKKGGKKKGTRKRGQATFFRKSCLSPFLYGVRFKYFMSQSKIYLQYSEFP